MEFQFIIIQFYLFKILLFIKNEVIVITHKMLLFKEIHIHLMKSWGHYKLLKIMLQKMLHFLYCFYHLQKFLSHILLYLENLRKFQMYFKIAEIQMNTHHNLILFIDFFHR